MENMATMEQALTAIAQLQQQVEHLTAHNAHLQQQQPVAPPAMAPNAAHGIKLKVPKPHECNGTKPQHWTHKMEAWIKGEGASLEDPNIIPIAGAYLKDGALNWFTQYEMEVAAGHRIAYHNWAEFKDAFIKRFTPMDPAKEARETLRKLRQTASVSAYATDFNTCMLELPNMDEADRVYTFIEGLKSLVRIHVKLQNPSTLSQAVELAIQADNTVWRDKNNHPGVGFPRASPGPTDTATPMELGQMHAGNDTRAGKKPIKCWHCGMTGHIERNCRRKKAEAAASATN